MVPKILNRQLSLADNLVDLYNYSNDTSMLEHGDIRVLQLERNTVAGEPNTKALVVGNPASKIKGSAWYKFNRIDFTRWRRVFQMVNGVNTHVFELNYWGMIFGLPDRDTLILDLNDYFNNPLNYDMQGCMRIVDQAEYTGLGTAPFTDVLLVVKDVYEDPSYGGSIHVLCDVEAKNSFFDVKTPGGEYIKQVLLICYAGYS